MVTEDIQDIEMTFTDYGEIADVRATCSVSTARDTKRSSITFNKSSTRAFQ